MNSINLIGSLTDILRTQHVKIGYLGVNNLLKCWSNPIVRRHGTITSFQGAPDSKLSTQPLPHDINSNYLTNVRVVMYSTNDAKNIAHTGISTLTKQQMHDLILHLTIEERNDLQNALHEFQSKKMKLEYEGQLAGVRWRSTFGRPSKLPTLGDVDPTGSYCAVPEDWLLRKYAETVPAPKTHDLIQVVIHNAIPFVGFGFLDNFCMILAGDQIETAIGSVMVISTMAAAALGNTISDIMGLGSAWYVERLALSLGVKPPKLTPIQLDMPSARRASNLGRVIGVTVGCLLGMFPLLFLKKNKEDTKLEETNLVVVTESDSN